MQSITIHQRKVQKGFGVLSGTYINAPNGRYDVLGMTDGKESSSVDLTDVSKGRPYARILSVQPGLLAVIEPQEVLIHG